MEAVSSVDQLVRLLRTRLQGRGRKSGPDKAQRAGSDPARVNALAALSQITDVEDGVLGRALIQNILVEELGPGLINDPRFQQVVDAVVQTLRQDEAMGEVFSSAIADLRSAAR